MSSSIRCPVCGSERKVLVYRVEEHHRSDIRGGISIVKCSSCNTVYLGNQDHAYQPDLYRYYDECSGKKVAEMISELTYKSYCRMLKRVSSITQINRILDVGCGRGEFVWTAQKLKYEAYGIDLSSEAVSIALANGLPVKKMSIYSRTLESGSWDLVTMFEVLEHVEEPMRVLKRATDLLRPGGILYITTPNYASLDRMVLGSRWRAFHPEHISYFTTRGLSQLVREHEDRLQHVSIESINLSSELIQLIVSFTRRAVGGSYRVGSAQIEADTKVDYRQISESSVMSRLVKRVLNQFLTIFGTGSSSVFVYRKNVTDGQ